MKQKFEINHEQRQKELKRLWFWVRTDLRVNNKDLGCCQTAVFLVANKLLDDIEYLKISLGGASAEREEK